MKIKFFVCHTYYSNNKIILSKLYSNYIGGSFYSNKYRIFYHKDNKGTNISSLNPFLNEYTVQYYAWKNMKFDYFGMAHYRRFLTFSNIVSNLDERNNINIKKLSIRNIIKYKLTSKKRIVDKLKKYDVICGYGHSCKKFGFDTVLDSYESSDIYSKNDIYKIGNLIKDKVPYFYNYYLGYLKSKNHFVCNIFLMKKNYFSELNAIQNAVIFDFINYKNKNTKSNDLYKRRIPGYMCEIIFGAYIYSLLQRKIPVCFVPKIVVSDCRSNFRKIRDLYSKLIKFLK